MARRPRRLPKFLEADELRSLIAAAAASSPRDLALVLALAYAGLRISEACALEWRDVADGRLLVRHGKGDKQRWLPIHRKLVAALDDLRKIGNFRNSRVFEISPRGAEFLIERLAVRAGIPREKAHPHALRHTAATNLLRQTGNLILVQRFLGHSSVSTTQIYTHLVFDDLADAVAQLE